MGKNEFIRLLKAAEDLRDALLHFNCLKRKYPAGIEMLVTREQYAAMEIVEGQIDNAMKGEASNG